MPFFEYSDNDDDDEDDVSVVEESSDEEPQAKPPAKGAQKNLANAAHVLDSDDENDAQAATPSGNRSQKRAAAEEDDGEAELFQELASRKKAKLASQARVEDPEAAVRDEAAARIDAAARAQLEATFAVEIDDDDEDLEPVAAVAAPAARAPSVEEIEDDDEDVADEELRREIAAVQQAGTATAAQEATDMLVLKVQCKHGHVQIRQGPSSNFVELRDKFRQYAIKNGWATERSVLTLEFDAEDVDVESQTPAEFDMDNGEVIDVKIS